MEKYLKIEISETNRGKVILNKKYKFNFSYEKRIKRKCINVLNIKRQINVNL